jgi:pyruvate/2-oxoglutarate dehydrogenase complex dihydrolipoamide acyltransferase (E2) component
VASESSTSRDKLEEEIQWVASERLLKILKDPDAEVPVGGLMTFVAKVGFQTEAPAADATTKIGTQNVLAILPGLPQERQLEILDGMQSQITQARKELPRG